MSEQTDNLVPLFPNAMQAPDHERLRAFFDALHALAEKHEIDTLVLGVRYGVQKLEGESECFHATFSVAGDYPDSWYEGTRNALRGEVLAALDRMMEAVREDKEQGDA